MKLDKRDLLLYAVTDRHWLNGRTLLEVVRESLDGGVTCSSSVKRHWRRERF